MSLKTLTLVCQNICNLRCIYCCQKAEIARNRKTAPDYTGIIEEMKRRGLVTESTQMRLGSGEISVHPQRVEILSNIKDFNCYILSNCAVYDDVLARHIALGKTTLNCSVDAGTRDTYAKVKGVDCFESLCKNLKLYSKTAKGLELKYIFLEGINDTLADVEGFVRLADELRPTAVIISRDIYSKVQLKDHTVNMMAEMFNGMKKCHLPVHFQADLISDKELELLAVAGAALK